MYKTNYNSELVKKNIEIAVKTREKFTAIRNLMVFFVVYSIVFTMSKDAIALTYMTVFLSLMMLYVLCKVITRLFDELVFIIRIGVRNHKYKKENGKKDEVW